MELWTALAIGFLGSFHCIGMCGPIALALPGSRNSGIALITGRLAYNLGRIISYGLLGAVFGLIGQSIALAGLQQLLSVILGAAIIIGVIGRFRFPDSLREKVRDKTGIARLFDQIKNTIRSMFKKEGLNTLFGIGILNGLLPCGFVYVGLAASLTVGSFVKGILFMMLFGLGTFPAMFAMSMAPGFISLTMRRKINRMVPYLALAFGIYLVYRGFS